MAEPVPSAFVPRSQFVVSPLHGGLGMLAGISGAALLSFFVAIGRRLDS